MTRLRCWWRWRRLNWRWQGIYHEQEQFIRESSISLPQSLEWTRSTEDMERRERMRLSVFCPERTSRDPS